MISDETYHFYDQVVSYTLQTLLQNVDKTTNVIIIKDFDPKYKSHMYVYNIVDMLHTIYNINSRYNMPLFKFWKFKRNCDKAIKHSFNHNKAISINDILEETKQLIPADTSPRIFYDIYDAYYRDRYKNAK